MRQVFQNNNFIFMLFRYDKLLSKYQHVFVRCLSSESPIGGNVYFYLFRSYY
jgi:hypothetical protein